MRRWFELGNSGNIFEGPWFLASDRWGGQGAASFVTMPHKEIVFEWLSAMATTYPMSAIWVRQEDQGVDPDPACQAQHIPRAFSQDVVSTPPFVANPVINCIFGPPIFTTDRNFSGGFGPAFLQFYSEPPDKFGS
jgi:hypothetical protein